MYILKDAAEKISRFNSNLKDRPRGSYHRVLDARAGRESFVDEDGSVSGEYLEMIDWALRSYFMMNRGNKMGSEADFVGKLKNKLASDEIKEILARLRDVTIMYVNLEDYKSDAEELYESMSNRNSGLSADKTHFCVGTTKVMHCLFPEFSVLLDKKVAEVVLKRSSNYNNFPSYWKVMRRCQDELIEWQRIFGNAASLLNTDWTPTTLTRIFDKCATIVGKEKNR